MPRKNTTNKDHVATPLQRVDAFHSHPPTPGDVARFWDKVPQGLGDTECWIWQGSINDRGYPQITWPGYRSARIATRTMWELVHNEPAPPYVCHHCDNPSCVNPSHLFAGSQSDNMLDAVRKDRVSRRLTPSDVRAIRELRAKNIPVREIADRFGVSLSTVERVIYRRRYTWVE